MYSVCILLKVVGYYDLSVLSMSVMGFQKKFGWRVGGWRELYPFFLDFWNFFNFAKPLRINRLGLESNRQRKRCEKNYPIDRGNNWIVRMMHTTHLSCTSGKQMQSTCQ